MYIGFRVFGLVCRVQGLYRGLYRDNGQENGNYYLGIVYGCFPESGHFLGGL